MMCSMACVCAPLTSTDSRAGRSERTWCTRDGAARQNLGTAPSTPSRCRSWRDDRPAARALLLSSRPPIKLCCNIFRSQDARHHRLRTGGSSVGPGGPGTVSTPLCADAGHLCQRLAPIRCSSLRQDQRLDIYQSTRRLSVVPTSLWSDVRFK